MNIYKCSRQKKDITLEKSAFELGLSTATLSRYENNGSPVPPETVVDMSRLYGDSELRKKHCSECPIGKIDGIKPSIHGMLEVGYMIPRIKESAEKCWNELLNIMSDGVVSDYEKENFIRNNYESMAQVKEVAENIISAMNQWDDDLKKGGRRK